MKVATRVKGKYFYGDKIVVQITSDEYNKLKEARSETERLPNYAFITFDSLFIPTEDHKELFDSLEDRLKVKKKEIADKNKGVKKVKLKDGSKVQSEGKGVDETSKRDAKA